MKQESGILQSTSLLLMLFLHSMLMSSDLAFVGWLLSVLWSAAALLVIPKIFYQVDRANLSRQVSAALVLLTGLLLGLSFMIIERAFTFELESSELQRMVMFIFFSTLIARIENVYDMQALSSSKMMIIGVIILVIFSMIVVRYSALILLPFLYELGWLHLAGWTFWQAGAGRLLILLFWLIALDGVMQLAYRARRRAT